MNEQYQQAQVQIQAQTSRRESGILPKAQQTLDISKRGRAKLPFALALALALALVFSACEQQESTLPSQKNIEDAVFASGYLEQENNLTVSAKVEGILVEFPLKEGDLVRKSDRIGLIESDVQNNQVQDAKVVYQDAIQNAAPNSPQLQQLQTQIEQAEQQLEFDKENYLRYKDLWTKKSVSQLDFQKVELQYKAAQTNLAALEENYTEAQNSLNLNVERSQVQLLSQQSMLKDYVLKTEESGQVIQVFKKQGELVRRGEAIARIGSGDYVIKLFVAEEDITKVDLNQSVAININTYPNKVFPAKITKIYPAFDEIEQSYIVEAQFEQMPEKMFSGTQLQANIETGSRKNVMVIPSTYVARGSFVMLESGEERQIETGSKNGEWTEVISGITAQDVITKPMN